MPASAGTMPAGSVMTFGTEAITEFNIERVDGHDRRTLERDLAQPQVHQRLVLARVGADQQHRLQPVEIHEHLTEPGNAGACASSRKSVWRRR